VTEAAPTDRSGVAEGAARPADGGLVRSLGARLPATAVVFAGNVVARGLGFLFPVLLAYGLDRDEYALATFLIATGFFAGELILTGFPTALTRALATSPPGPERARALASSLVAGAPLLVVSALLGAALAAAGQAPAGLLVLVIVGLTVDAYYFASLRGLQRFGWLAIYRVAANGLQLLLLVGLIVLDLVSVELAVVLYSLVYLGPILVIELLARPVVALARAGAGTRLVDRARMLELTRFAIPALISGTAYGAILGFDVFFVRLFAPDEVADYGAARSLSLPFLLVPFALSIVLMPRVAATTPARQGGALGRALAISTGAAAVGWLGYAAFGPLAIAAIFPPSYAAAAEPLTTLAPAVGLLGVYSVLSQWTLGTGRPWAAAISLSIGALVTLIGHVTLTASFGAVGAGLAMLIGVAVALAVLGALALRRLRGMRAVAA
jgi:O-antigen/teichoic acid export membrane protein